MPIRRFRSVEELSRASAAAPTAPADAGANLAQAAALSRVALWLSGRRQAPGVYRFRSVEEAARARDRR